MAMSRQRVARSMTAALCRLKPARREGGFVADAVRK
jgi:hypothetical protein